MTDRTVSVQLQAKVAGFIAGMRSAGQSAKAAFGAATSASEKHRRALGEVSTALGIMGGAAVVGVGLAVKTFSEFDAKMSQVKALSHATAGEMQGLSQAAMTAGADIGFSASQAADAEIELVKAGVSVRDIMGGGLRGALTLAAAGQIDVAQATEIATVAMTQFGVAGKDVPHVADLLAAGADKALGGVDDLGMALKQGGLVASQFGLSVDDTVGTLAAFANAGLLGSDAGTSFKQMLLSLANPTGKAAQLMQQLGINAYDAQGQFVGIAALAGQLHDKLGGLSQAQRQAALSTIFGSDAIRAASVLYQQGQKGIQGWIDGVNDQGFAAEQAAAKMDNLQGDLQKLRAAFENDLIKAGSGANGVLRDLVQGATSLLHVIDGIPRPVLEVGLGLAALLGSGLLAAAGLLKVVSTASQLRQAAGDARAALASLVERMAASGTAGSKLATGLKGAAGVLSGPWGLAIGAGVVALGYFAAKQAEAKARVQDLTQALIASGGAMDANYRQLVATNLQEQGMYDAANKLGINLGTLTDAVLGNRDAFAQVGRQIDATVGSGRNYSFSQAQAVSKVEEALYGQNEEVQKSVQAYKNLAAAGVDVGGSQQGAAKSVGEVAAAAQDAATEAQAYKDALDALNSAADTAEGTNIAYNRQLDATRKELQHGAKTLNIHTKAGQDNRQAILDLVQAAQDHANAMVADGKSADKVNGYLQTQRDKMVAMVAPFFHSRDAAKKYIDKLLGIPKNVGTDVHNNATTAGKKIDGYKNKIYSIPKHVTTTVRVAISGGPGRIAAIRGELAAINAARNGATGGLFDGRRFHFAGGGEFSGLLSGPGSGTSDSIAAPFLSNGEYVMKHAAVQFWGKPFMDFVNAAGAGKFQGSVRGVGGGSGAGNGTAVGGGTFTGTLVTDTGHIVGIVRGELHANDRAKKQAARAGAGLVV